MRVVTIRNIKNRNTWVYQRLSWPITVLGTFICSEKLGTVCQSQSPEGFLTCCVRPFLPLILDRMHMTCIYYCLNTF